MGERDPHLEKETIRLPDGRRLIFFRFPEPDAATVPGAAAPPPPAIGPVPAAKKEG